MEERFQSHMIENAALRFWKVRAGDEFFLLKRLEKHHRPSFLHSVRVGYYSYLVGQAMKLAEAEQLQLWKSALLHDIGKLMVSNKVLSKTDILEREEWELLSKHCMHGVEIVHQCQLDSVKPEVILYHHENLDGTGYYGLQDSQLDLMTRIVRVVDSYDTMLAAFGLHHSHAMDTAMDELYRWNEIFFDPMIVQTFHHVILQSA